MNNYYTFAFIFYQVYLFELEHVIQASIGSVALTCLQKQQFLQNIANVKKYTGMSSTILFSYFAI